VGRDVVASRGRLPSARDAGHLRRYSVRQGELEAERIECAPYDKAAFRDALDEVRGLTAETDPERFVPKLQDQCAAAGVAVVFVPALSSTGVSGATRWLHPE
jgi:hypothetical protein